MDPALRSTQVSMYAAAIGIAAFVPFAAMAPVSWGAALAGVQFVWGVFTFLGAWSLTRLPKRWVPRVAALIAGAMPVFFAPALWLSGGYASPAFAWLVALPLAVVVVFRSQIAAVATGAVGSVAVAVLLMLIDDSAAALVALRWVQVAVSGGIAWIGAAAFAASNRRERKAIIQREAAAKLLAASELQRERNERLAAIGQLAAGVAHEINNPLAFVKANLEFLLLSAREGEAADALRESLGGVERMRRIVEELTAVVRSAPPAGTDTLMHAEDQRIRVPLVRPQPSSAMN